MNALLPRDQSTLPKACLGSLLGPMFARLVLLLALSPVGKLEATRWKHLTTGSFQSCVPRPTFPTSSNVTVPASETSSRTCSASFKDICKANLDAQDSMIVYSGWLQGKIFQHASIAILCFPCLHVWDKVASSTLNLCIPRSCSSAPDGWNKREQTS